jgi:hypothetical protein
MADTLNNHLQRKVGLLAIPGVVVSALPILACALCWPAYAAVISSLGLGFLASSTYLLPLTGALLIVAVVALGFQIKPNGYGPFLLGIVSAATILSGKFMIGSNLMTYSGIVLLVFASGWSLIPGDRPSPPLESTCTSSGEGAINRLEDRQGMYTRQLDW